MTTLTKHKEDCQMAFGRKDKTCERCRELLSGAEARSGWQGAYYKNKKINEENRSRWIREHDCSKDGCGVVCTAFQW